MSFKDIVYSEVNTKAPVSTIREISSARRHVIKVGGILSERTTYSTRKSKTKNLVSAPTDRIAIFANEYIPSHFANEEWVTYKLTVNGQAYDITPLNSHKPGIKIVKYATFKDDEPHAIILDEPIKEAYLTITLRSPNPYETPFVSNLKVVTGKGV